MLAHLHIWWTLVGVSAFEKGVEKDLFGTTLHPLDWSGARATGSPDHALRRGVLAVLRLARVSHWIDPVVRH